jgi:hypothetical protein
MRDFIGIPEEPLPNPLLLKERGQDVILTPLSFRRRGAGGEVLRGLHMPSPTEA